MTTISPERLAVAQASNVEFENRVRVARYSAMTQFASLGSWRDDDIDRFVTRFVPFTHREMSAAASLEGAFQARSLALATGRAVRPAVLTPAAVATLVTNPETYWRAPAVRVYTALAEGAALDYAVQEGAKLVGEQMRRVMTKSRFAAITKSLSNAPGSLDTAFARVLGAGACKYCATIIGYGSARYSTKDLEPLHDSCNCGVVGVSEL